MNEAELRRLIVAGETTTVEFKNDRGPLADADLLETVVCLANAQGGTLLIGVEDDGTITGLHADHRTRPGMLAAFVASRTVPPLSVEAAFVETAQGPVAVLTVPAARQPIATSDGRLVIRYTDTHGRPGCRPLYPYELASWRADRGLADLSAMLVPEATWDDLDPLEFARLRRMVEENRGDAALLELSDEAVARALGLVRVDGSMLTPTLAGLLLVGKESALRQHVPAHEVAFQVLRGTDVAVNEFRRWPLLRSHEWLMQAVDVRNEEQELMMGGMRVGVPHYDRRGIREAVNNALIHRDYTRLGAVHVQLHDGFTLIANPGGFVQGVRADNLLVAAPRPRNPHLADAFKRVGLVERTGRGVSIIFTGQLRNGRPAPSYDRSTETSISVTLDGGPSDLAFVEAAIQAGKRLGRGLTVPELLVLWETWTTGSVTVSEAARLGQSDLRAAALVLRDLQQNELLMSFFSSGRRAYRLAPTLSGETGHVSVGPSFSGLSLPELENKIMGLARQHGRIQRGEVEALSGLGRDRVYRLLKRLVEDGKLELVGRGQAAFYRPIG